MLARAAKPKLSLAVPSMTSSAATHCGPKSPIFAHSPNPINTPTARNTLLNQRGYSTYQAPTYSAYKQPSAAKSILKRGDSGSSSASSGSKKIAFNDVPMIQCVSPMPEDYHGDYVKMSREERRWSRR